jgi:ABC-type siderophore export system fused ATPase/permease subunit
MPEPHSTAVAWYCFRYLCKLKGPYVKYLRVSTLLVSLLALLFAGCGKSQEQKKMEADLNSEVNALKKDVESSLSGFGELRNKLDATRQMHNDLQKKHAEKMKNHSADDITTAGRMLR